MTDQAANINLRLALDQAALNQSKAGVGDLDKSLEALLATTKDTGASADETARAIGQAMSGIRPAVEDDVAAVKALNDAFAQTSQTAASLGSSGALTGLRRTGSALTQLGLGDIGQPIQKIGDLGQVIKELGQISETVGPALDATAISFGGIEIALGPLLLILAPVALAVADVAIGLKLLSDQATAAATAAKQAYDDQKKLDDQKDQDRQIAKSKTTQQNNDDAADLLIKRKEAQDRLDKAQSDRAQTAQQYSDLGSSFNPGERSRLGAQGNQQDQNIKDAQAALAAVNAEWLNTTGQLNDDIKAQEGAKKAIKDKADAQAEADKELEKSVGLAQQNQQLIDSSTSKSVQTRIDGIEAEKKAIEDALATNKASADETTKLNQQLSDLSGEEKNLTATVLPAVQAREAETQAVKDFTKEVQGAEKDLDDIGKAIGTAVKGIADAQHTLADQTASAAEKEAFDATKVEEDKGNQLLKISTDYARKQVDLAQQAADQAAAALNSLNDNIAKDATTLQRNQQQDAVTDQQKQQDIVRKAAEQQVVDLQSHLQKLQDIQNQYADSNQQALLDRNFLQLAKNAESQKTAIDTENDHYTDQENQRQEALAIQLNDEQNAYQRQREARLTAYQQQIQDAGTQYEITLRNQQIANENKARDDQTAEQRSIDDAQTAAQQRVTVLQEGLTEENKLYEQAAEQRIAILVQEQAQLAAMAAKQIISSPLGQLGTGLLGGLAQAFAHRAAGGPLAAGQASWVNEPGSSGNESFNGVTLPGAGLFLPSRAGNVNAGGGKNMTVNFTINGATDPQRTADLVEQKMTAVLQALTQ